jgi:8-amino-7-oxononanoate synthase
MLEQLHEAPVLVFNSGYDANIGFFSCVPQRNDVVFYDEFAHASIRDGIRLGLAKSNKFRHNDLEDLETQLARLKPDNKPSEKADRECYVATESVFSMDGDSPDLHALVKLCDKFGCRLIVDEAHAIGVFAPGGVGLMQEMDLHRHAFARILTFGKAMGVHGAAVAGNIMLKEYLINFARSFIYSTALPPHTIATLLAAYHYCVTESGEEKQQKLRENIEYFGQGLVTHGLTQYFMPGKSAIQSCLLPGNLRVRKVAGALRNAGFDLRPILAPTVPEGKERLRFCLHSYNTRQQIDDVQNALSVLIKST